MRVRGNVGEIHLRSMADIPLASAEPLAGGVELEVTGIWPRAVADASHFH